MFEKTAKVCLLKIGFLKVNYMICRGLPAFPPKNEKNEQRRPGPGDGSKKWKFMSKRGAPRTCLVDGRPCATWTECCAGVCRLATETFGASKPDAAGALVCGLRPPVEGRYDKASLVSGF